MYAPDGESVIAVVPEYESEVVPQDPPDAVQFVKLSVSGLSINKTEGL